MATARWHGVGPTDPLYAAVLSAGVLGTQPRTRLGLAMGLFALLVGMVDWVERRRQTARDPEPRRSALVGVGLTLPVLGAWYALATRPPSALSAYFGLLAAFFFLVAVRDAAVLSLSPVELLLQGYVNLVAVYLVFGAAADAVDRLQIVLVLVGVGVYLVRKSFRWGGMVLAGLAPDREA